jgi:hypothetical protein
MSCGVDLCPAGTVGGIAVPEAAIAMRGGAYAQPGMAMDPYGCTLSVKQVGGACPCSKMYGGRRCGSCLNSLFGKFRRRGGYRATKRDKKYLRLWRQGRSIGFTMRSSLKAKGLIPRANGTRKVSNKYK